MTLVYVLCKKCLKKTFFSKFKDLFISPPTGKIFFHIILKQSLYLWQVLSTSSESQSDKKIPLDRVGLDLSSINEVTIFFYCLKLPMQYISFLSAHHLSVVSSQTYIFISFLTYFLYPPIFQCNIMYIATYLCCHQDLWGLSHPQLHGGAPF